MWMKFTNYLDENLLYIRKITTSVIRKLPSFNQNSKSEELSFRIKGAWNRECCHDDQNSTKTRLLYNSSRILSVSNIGKCSFNPGRRIGHFCALTPTAQGIGSYNFQKVGNGGDKVLVSDEKHIILPGNYKRRGHCFW